MITEKINIEELLEKAKNSTDKEAYTALDKTPEYRIGVGVRATPPNPPIFFIEIIIALTDESKKVNLPKLEKIIHRLKMLQSRKYALTFEDDNCISCEITVANQDLNPEYQSAKALMETTLT